MKTHAALILLLVLCLAVTGCIWIDDDDDDDYARIYVHNYNTFNDTLDIYLDNSFMFTLSPGETGRIDDVRLGVRHLEAFWWDPYYQEWTLVAEIYLDVYSARDFHWTINY